MSDQEVTILVVVIVILALVILLPGIFLRDKLKHWTGKFNVKLFGQQANAEFDIEKESSSTSVSVKGSRDTEVRDTYEGSSVEVEESDKTDIRDTGRKSKD